MVVQDGQGNTTISTFHPCKVFVEPCGDVDGPTILLAQTLRPRMPRPRLEHNDLGYCWVGLGCVNQQWWLR